MIDMSRMPTARCRRMGEEQHGKMLLAIGPDETVAVCWGVYDRRPCITVEPAALFVFVDEATVKRSALAT